MHPQNGYSHANEAVQNLVHISSYETWFTQHSTIVRHIFTPEFLQLTNKHSPYIYILTLTNLHLLPGTKGTLIRQKI